ncbi:MAG: Gfo/Idh/MocA family oxidoreductase [Proteobacteria bacterium]|nr:Gfo/Idh/MocA family oxidoreductase [Bacteroidota bacterium]MBU1711802.1 Gfo/Idh/MocA family oxidoreductase [Pseudomonadota bacterium]
MEYIISVVGLGSIGLKHLKNILDHMRNIKEIYVYDIDIKSAEKKVQALEDKRIIIAGEISSIPINRLNLAFICTPSSEHYRDGFRFISNKIPVFIEKPVTTDPEDCRKLLSIKNVPVIVGCNMRYHPGVRNAREAVLGGKLGKVSSARAYSGHFLGNWRPGVDYRDTYSAKTAMGGGVLWDGIHEIDYMSWILGKVEAYSSFAANQKLLGIETEETADMILHHSNNTISSIHLDYIQPLKRRGIEIVGTEGTYIWNSTGKNPEHLEIRILTKKSTEIIRSGKYEDTNSMYVDEMKELFSLLEGNPVEATNLLTIETACEEISIISDMRANIIK